MAGNIREKFAKHAQVASNRGSFNDRATVNSSMVQPQAFQGPPNKFSNQFDQRFTPSQFDASGVTPDPDPFGMNRPMH